MRNIAIFGAVAVLIGLTVYTLTKWRTAVVATGDYQRSIVSDSLGSLLPLDAHGVAGIHEITKAELLALISRRRPLSESEKAQINRGCLGLTCLYQGLDLTRWPESAPGTRAYLRLEDALNRSCSDSAQNFVFVKQAWWTTGKPPTPDSKSREVPLSSVTRTRPGWYTFNYCVYFPATKTYAWINHREYGFPANLIWPMRAYLSLAPPPLDDNRPAELFCSTCR